MNDLENNLEIIKKQLKINRNIKPIEEIKRGFFIGIGLLFATPFITLMVIVISTILKLIIK